MRDRNREQIASCIREQIASVTQTDPKGLDENMSFIKCGISSIQAIMIINRIKKNLKLEINPVAMFEHKNISELSLYLYQCQSESEL